MSVKRQKIVHGVKVRKLPLGAFLSFNQNLSDLAVELLDMDVNGKNIFQILLAKDNNKDDFKGFLSALFSKSPLLVARFMADILEIEEEKLLSNEEIGINEFWDIIETFIEMNELGKLVPKIKSLLDKLKTRTGLKGQ